MRRQVSNPPGLFRGLHEAFLKVGRKSDVRLGVSTRHA